MRLYLKLFGMIMIAAVIQLAVGGPGEWLDETQFAIRVYVADKLGVPPQSPALVDAADSLRDRQVQRVMARRAPKTPVFETPTPLLAADDRCETADSPPQRLYARAGDS